MTRPMPGNKILIKTSNNDIYKGIIKQIGADDTLEIDFYNPPDSTEDIRMISPRLGLISKKYVLDWVENKYFTFQEAFCHRFKNLYFRRVATCQVKKENLLQEEYLILDPYGQLNSENQKSTRPADRLFYNFYYGYTTAFCLRNNDMHHGESLYFSSKNECDLNEHGFMITLPHNNGHEVPTNNSLVAGYTYPGPLLNCKATPYKKWFKCSEQFYKLWTIFMLPDHPALQHYSPSNIINKLSTDNLRISLRKNTNNHREVLSSEKYVDFIPRLYWIKTEKWSQSPYMYQKMYQKMVIDLYKDQNLIQDFPFDNADDIIFVEKIQNNLMWMNFELPVPLTDEPLPILQ